MSDYNDNSKKYAQLVEVSFFSHDSIANLFMLEVEKYYFKFLGIDIFKGWIKNMCSSKFAKQKEAKICSQTKEKIRKMNE